MQVQRQPGMYVVKTLASADGTVATPSHSGRFTATPI